jgi:hypothetical protein
LLGTLPVPLARPTPYCHDPLCGSNPPSLAPIYCATAMAWRLLAHMSQNTSRTHYMFTPWSCATPTSVVTSPSNILRPRLISHELVVSFDNPWASCSHKQWPSNLHQHSANAKSLAPVYTSKGLPNSANLSTGGEDYLFLSSPKTWWQNSSHSWDSHFFQQVG